MYYWPRMARAKIFTNGGSQAVRLPKSVAFPEGQTEVVVRREGRRARFEQRETLPASARPQARELGVTATPPIAV
jgi:hypothetical protein